MSGLAALLAGHNPPDIYLWQHNASQVPDIQHAVEHAGWKFAYLDGWTVEDKTSFLKATAAALELPDFGENFDALSDCLGGLSADGHNGIVLLWDGWSPLARADESCFSVALSVLGARVNAERGDRFAVLLRGEGPPIDVPELPHARH